MWAACFASVVSYAHLEQLSMANFARSEALVNAQGVAAAVLRHLLPRSLFERLAAGDQLTTLTRVNADVAVLVADIVGFTALSASAESPTVIFDVLNSAFREFEAIAHLEGAFKIKTLGDCVIFTAGLRDFPSPAQDRKTRVELLARVARRIHETAVSMALQMRIGIHVGSVVSGVLNSHGFVYDVWGEGILHAMAAEAAAPLGGTAFTAEAAEEFDEDFEKTFELITALPRAGKGKAREMSAVYSLFQPLSPIKVDSCGDFTGIGETRPRRESSVERFASAERRQSSATVRRLTESLNRGLEVSATKAVNFPSSTPSTIARRFSAFGGVPSVGSSRRPSFSLSLSLSPLSLHANRINGVNGGLNSWGWDIFTAAKKDSAALPMLAIELLRPTLACGLVSEVVAETVVKRLCESYGSEPPFHNAFHGVATLQAVIMLSRTVPGVREVLSGFDILLLAIAALGHDAGHRGFKNAHEIAQRSPIAIATNQPEGPVLERFHAALTLHVVESSGALDFLGLTERADAMATIAKAIMKTDMAGHKDVVSELTRCGSLDKLSQEVLLGALVHVADISAHAFTRAVSIAWTARISDEFALQSALEESLGLAKTPMMVGLEKPLNRARLQADFLTVIVVPLWRAIAAVADGSLDEPLHNVESNAAFYAAEYEKLSTINGPSGKGFFSRIMKETGRLLLVDRRPSFFMAEDFIDLAATPNTPPICSPTTLTFSVSPSSATIDAASEGGLGGVDGAHVAINIVGGGGGGGKGSPPHIAASEMPSQFLTRFDN